MVVSERAVVSSGARFWSRSLRWPLRCLRASWTLAEFMAKRLKHVSAQIDGQVGSWEVVRILEENDQTCRSFGLRLRSKDPR